VLAIDPGTRTIGLAVSDESGVIAQPLGDEPAAPAQTLVERLAGHARQANAHDLVVGLPLRLDGSQGPEAEAARLLAGRLGEATGLPVHLFDERLTSVAAERALIGGGVRRRLRRRLAHRVSAALLLQSYLDLTKSGRRG
jgi:putative Holliday junction resolvase